MDSSTPPFELLEDIEEYVEWRDVAEALAKHILADGSMAEALERLDQEACDLIDEEARMRASGMDEWTGWESVYAAAQLLRDTDRQFPAIRGTADGPRIARKLAEAQRAAAIESRQGDPTKSVLVSPRLRGNVIERIVRTHGDRVVAEYLHTSAGWVRHGAMDLRVVLEGVPLAARISEALSREKGECDELPTEECLALFREIDPKAQFSRLCDLGGCQQATLFPELRANERVRLTEAEVRDPNRHAGAPRLGGDASNAELASAILECTPALWNWCTMVAVAPPDGEPGGIAVAIHGQREDDGYFRASTRLRLLVTRRFEMLEEQHGTPWRRFIFRVMRAEHPEWTCEATYDFGP